ncbi:hypothetical protein Cgig2_000473 [Carnegiea gigantea]|uniref:Uncharacterized protein n=1 Tax=Carnegiea gigantea TaxID=171969 RepID=A0A9Q1K4Y5_9CARY|nr:hypothetical protein Cgig2_000473 [Carnegiea gigantea]
MEGFIWRLWGNKGFERAVVKPDGEQDLKRRLQEVKESTLKWGMPIMVGKTKSIRMKIISTTSRRYSKFLHVYRKARSLVEEKISEDNINNLHPLEKDIPTNKQQFGKLQIGCPHEEADQETRKILEEKAPKQAEVQVGECINIEYLLNPAEKSQAKQETIEKCHFKEEGVNIE